MDYFISITALVLSIIFSVISYTAWTSRFKKVAILFVSYICLIVSFSYVYYLIYQHDPNSFVFNDSIRLARKDSVDKQLEEELEQKKEGIMLLGKLHNLIKDHENKIHFIDGGPFHTLVKFSDDEFIYEFDLFQGPARGKSFGDIVAPHRLYIYRHDSVAWHSTHNWNIDVYYPTDVNDKDRISKIDKILLPTNIEQYIAWVEALSDETKEDIARISGIKDSPTDIISNYWSLIDFVYFSVITQTTVGFGDILPNNSIVRTAVVIQILLGLFILVILIGVILSNEI